MRTRRIITGAINLLRGRRGSRLEAGTTEELTNTRFGIAAGAKFKNQKNVVNTLLLMYSKENETLFI
ncbi:hypothetical protein [Flavobacterium sp. 7A]|uniref:hypothetical protein n=1 Tax=Flavobacterium sp. 7A TaxID=2940571 RepID=UPI002225DCC3|nr:hypothetical protein [Flavobacterium sp. 7A]MCW2118631.1 hypothetical protein [Flavobacterium sp. 7A]